MIWWQVCDSTCDERTPAPPPQWKIKKTNKRVGIASVLYIAQLTFGGVPDIIHRCFWGGNRIHESDHDNQTLQSDSERFWFFKFQSDHKKNVQVNIWKCQTKNPIWNSITVMTMIVITTVLWNGNVTLQCALPSPSLETTDAVCVFSEQNKCLCHISEFFFSLFCAISLEE